MMSLVLIETVEQLQKLAVFGGISLLDAASFTRHRPDAHWVLAQDENILARCSLWWKTVPPDPKETFGLIGHYAAQTAEAAQILLNHACTELASQGCTLAIAPIDGNTWRNYRLITERGNEPAFLLEPNHPDEWVTHFQCQGFTPFSYYTSALAQDLSQTDSRLEKVKVRLADMGVKIRPLEMNALESELSKIYAVSLVAFQENFLYTPIAEEEFLSQYLPLKAYLQPEFILLAEHHHQRVGFLFAIPDLLQAQRGEAVNTVIIKTVAILPQRIYAGLGNILVAHCHQLAQEQGYLRVIHALMHSRNNSRNLSARYAQTIRQYALFSKAL